MGRQPRPRTALVIRVGRRIQEERERIGVSVADLARKVGIHPTVEYKIERGEVALTVERLALYAEIFSLSVGNLFEERDEKVAS